MRVERKSLRGILAMTCCLATALALGGSGGTAQASTAPLSGPTLQVSQSPNRSAPVKLDQATLRGKVHILLGGDTTDVTSVAFRLDTPLGQARSVDKSAPFDFSGSAANGTAKAADTTRLANGTHAVLVEVARKDGSTFNTYSRFTVANGETPTPAPTPTNSPTASPTQPAGGKGCALPAYPTPDCTGVPKGTKLTEVKGDFVANKPGQVVDGVRIAGKLLVRANDVKIRNSEIYGGVGNYNSDGPDFRFSISHSSVGAPTGCNGDVGVGFANYTADHVHIHNFGDGFRDSGDNILIEDSFVKLCANPGDHSDGLQGYKGGKNVIFRHNTVDQRPTKFVGTTSPVFIADGSAGIVVENNLLAGGGYTLRLHDGKGFVAKGNRIVKDSWQYGAVNSDCGSVAWSDNTIVTIDDNYGVTSTVGPLRCQ